MKEEIEETGIFKSYLRQLLRQLKALREASEKGDQETVSRLIDELIEDTQNGLV